MAQLNAVFPLRLCIAGEPDEQQLEQLSARLGTALGERLTFARGELERRLERVPPAVVHAPVIRLPDGLPSDRADAIRAAVAEGFARALRGDTAAGEPGVILAQHRPRRPARPAEPWVPRAALRFHLRLRAFAAFSDLVQDEGGNRVRALYPERLSELVTATAVVAEARVWLDKERLVELLAERVERALPRGQGYFFAYSVFERERARLLELDERHELSGLPELSANPGRVLPDGRVALAPGGRLLFVFLALPAVRLRDVLLLLSRVELQVRVRDVATLVDPERFQALFGVPWEGYLQECGDAPATLHAQSFTTLRRVSAATLRLLLSELVTRRVDSAQAWFGGLRLLNGQGLAGLPDGARAGLGGIVLESMQDVVDPGPDGVWDESWDGAYVYAVLAPSAEQRESALYRPQARLDADALQAFLRRDRRHPWPFELLSFLIRRFRGQRPGRGPSPALAFQYLLDELLARGAFDELLEAVEQARNGDLHQLVVGLLLATRHATRARVVRSAALLNARRETYMVNAYDAEAGEILLERDPLKRLRLGMLAVEADARCSTSREVKQIKPARLAALREAVELEARELLGQILRGEDARSFDQDGFAQEVVARAARRIGLSDDDLEEIVIERSVRLVSLARAEEGGLVRHYVTYEWVERAGDGPWQTVPDSRREESDGEFELLLFMLRYQKTAAFFQALAIGVTVLALVALAWELGVIAGLIRLAGAAIELAGGAWTVGISIGISELIYVCTAEHYSVEGFLTAALEGYLFALGFRGAGLVGRALARSIGTQSLERLIGGWVLERLTVGVLGGAGSALLVTFSHDLLDMALGRREGFRSPGEYVRHMALGAALGIVFEFGAAALQPLLRAAGRTGLDTLASVVERVRAEGLSVTRWIAATEEALQKLRQNLGELLQSARAGELGEAFGERVAQVTAALRELRQTALFQRVLELSDVGLSRSVSEGLDKLLAAAEGRLDSRELLALFNRLRSSPAALRRFLEAVQRLDESFARLLAERGELVAFSRATRLHTLLLERGAETGVPLLERVFSGSVARTEAFLERLAAYGAEDAARAVDILLRRERISPRGLLACLERFGRLPALTEPALERLYAAAERAAADTLLLAQTREQLERLLWVLVRVPRFARVAPQTLGEPALAGLARLVGNPALDAAAIGGILQRATPARLGRLLEVLRSLDQDVFERLGAAQLEELAGSGRLLELLERRGAPGWALVDGPFGRSIAEAERFLERLGATRADADRVADILLRPGQVIPPDGLLLAAGKLPALADDVLAGLDHLYANGEPAAAKRLLEQADAAALGQLLPFLGRLPNGQVAILSQQGYLPALASSPRVLAFAQQAGNLGRLLRLVRVRGEAPADVIAALERFADVNAAFAEVAARRLSAEELALAGTLDRPGYPGGSAAVVRGAATLMRDDVEAAVARQLLEPPAGGNVTGVEAAGAGEPAPDVWFTLRDGRADGREATHTETRGRTPEDLILAIARSLQDKVVAWGGNPRGLAWRAREVHLQVRPGPGGFDFDPLLERTLLQRALDRVVGLGADVSRVVIYDSRGNVVFVWE